MTLSMILIGILPSVFFGVATTLMGKTGGSDRQRVMGAVLGGLLMAAVATPFLHPAWTPLNLGVSFLTGLLLGVGVCDQLRSYSVLGMSRTMPLSTGGQLVLMSLAGIAIFGEWLHGGALPYGLAAIAVLIVGIWFLSRSESGSDAASLDWKRGAFLLTTSTLGLVAFPLIIKWFAIAPAEFLLPQAVGYTVYCAIFFAIQGRGGVAPRTRCATAACSPRPSTASCGAPPSCFSSSTPTSWARGQALPSPSSASSSPRRWASCGSMRPARARNCAGPSSASPSSSWARSWRASPRPSTSPERRGDYPNI